MTGYRLNERFEILVWDKHATLFWQSITNREESYVVLAPDINVISLFLAAAVPDKKAKVFVTVEASVCCLMAFGENP